jgi:hypothetical protein
MADNNASDSEPHERTTMQQEKAILKKKQEKREAGLQITSRPPPTHPERHGGGKVHEDHVSRSP